MRTRARAARGVTIIEMAVVIAIIAVLSALAYSSLARQAPRARLANATFELQSLIHGARQAALSYGTPVAVLIYPNYVANGVRGRAIVFQDACFDFLTGGATCGVSYAAYDPASPAKGTTASQAEVFTIMDLPTGVYVGPANGMGGVALPAPLAGIPVNVACSFCGATGGAVVFDPRGQASFYSVGGGAVAGPLVVTGGASLSLGYDPNVTSALTGQRTLVILSASGAVQTINGG